MNADRHGHWRIQSLWDSLAPCLPDLSIEVLESLPSTNQALVDRLRLASRNAQGRIIRADDLSPLLLVAVQQTQGRGRLGRSWESVPGASLTFSLSLPIHRPDWSGLSLAVGLSLAEALDPAGQRIGLKWPNDLCLMDSLAAAGLGRKLGGVLIEAVTLGPHKVAVIGVGINVLPLHLAEPVAALSEIDPEARPPAVLARLMPPLARALIDFEARGFVAVAADYARRDVLRGKEVTTTDPACPRGCAAGVAEDGALLLSLDGQTRRIVSGEVSVRPVDAAPVR
jgi:BirA family biotin operon repressor/biotin-[acetyl-CoA-carboxylase] ligase